MLKITKKLSYTISLLFAGLMLTACQEEAAPPMGPRGPVEVEVMTVRNQEINLETELPGRTTAYRVAEVRPQVNGIIQKRDFVEGSDVEAGQLLYQIDPATYQAQYDSAKASLAKAEASEHSAKLKADRYRTLVKTKAVSEIDQIEMDATWKQSIADIAAAKASLNSAKINLDYTRITAPISGVIGRSEITEGALVTAQQSVALAKIQQLDPIYVDVTQSSTSMLRLKKEFSKVVGEELPKTEVVILLEDGSVYKHKGTLEFSDVTVDQSTGAVTLRTIIANPDRELLPGMFVRAKLSNGAKEGIIIPASAISRTPKGDSMVMIVNGESKIEARILQIGQTLKEGVVVLEGLAAGEQIVTAGLQNIRPGAEVKTVQKVNSPQEKPAKQGE